MKSCNRIAALPFVALLVLAGCPEESKDTVVAMPKPSAATSSKTSSEPSSTPPPASASGSGTPTPTPTPTPGGGLTVTPRAKAELDGKEPDAGYNGNGLAVTGQKYGFTVPAAWKVTGDKAAADGNKSQLGATGYADGDDMAKKTEAVLASLGLTACTWGGDEDAALGKDKLPSKVADGVCKRDKVDVRVVRAIVSGDKAKIVAVGSWDDPGGDDKGVFESLRAIAEGGNIQACCSAITQNMASAPLQQKPIYAAALVVCQSLVNTQQGREALGQIRGKLPGVPIPAACN
jgi:hypothetical protein